jgi:hypothetical protein
MFAMEVAGCYGDSFVLYTDNGCCRKPMIALETTVLLGNSLVAIKNLLFTEVLIKIICLWFLWKVNGCKTQVAL